MKNDKVEGEGSYSATRNYNQHVAESIERGDIHSGAEDALRAVEGPEGKDLKRAEEQAKQGPAQVAPPAATRPVDAI
jgi:hypothetical protein